MEAQFQLLLQQRTELQKKEEKEDDDDCWWLTGNFALFVCICELVPLGALLVSND